MELSNTEIANKNTLIGINIEGKNLKLWNDIILEMIEKTKI